MGVKLYGLTAIPSAANRDANGVYYIRTSTGFKLYTVANSTGKELVRLEVDDLSITSDKLADNAVGLGKLQTVPAFSFLGRKTGVAGSVEQLTVTDVKSMLSIVESQWTSHVDGVYYNGNVGLGSTPDSRYRLYIPAEQSKMSHIAHQVTIGGEAGQDMSINTITYDRNQLTNAAYRGTVSVEIQNGGSVDTTQESLNKLFNSKNDFLVFLGLTTSSIVTITVEMPEHIPHYGLAYWQPFVQNRMMASESNTVAQSVRVEVYDTVGAEWVSPTGGGWSTSDYESESIRGLWSSGFMYPNAVNINKVRYVLSGFTLGSLDANYYLTQLGLRNYSAPAYAQYFSVLGDSVLGDSVFEKDLTVNGRLRVKDKVSVVNSSVLLGDSHGELIICDPSAEITLYLRATGGTPIDRVLKIVNLSGTAVVNLYDYDNSLVVGALGYGITYELIYVSVLGAWIKVGEYSNA